jgi:hypothetical protein
MDKIPRQLHFIACVAMDVVFPWARIVAQQVSLPPFVLEPCFQWLTARDSFQKDAVKIVLSSVLSHDALFFLKLEQQANALQFFGHLTKYAPDRFPEIHLTALFSGCLQPLTALRLLDFLSTVLRVKDYRCAVNAFCSLYGEKESADECCICTEAVVVPDCFLECRHVFHAACLAQWRHTCPMCRRVMRFVQPTDPFLVQPQISCSEGNANGSTSEEMPSIEQYAATVDHFLRGPPSIFSAYVAIYSNVLDVRLVRGQTGATHDEAVRALLENDGDVVSAILDLIS